MLFNCDEVLSINFSFYELCFGIPSKNLTELQKIFPSTTLKFKFQMTVTVHDCSPSILGDWARRIPSSSISREQLGDFTSTHLKIKKGCRHSSIWRSWVPSLIQKQLYFCGLISICDPCFCCCCLIFYDIWYSSWNSFVCWSDLCITWQKTNWKEFFSFTGFYFN